MTGRTITPPPLSRLALRVPEITVYFWIIKSLSTALGESTSDHLVNAMDPVLAVGLGFVGFVGALVLLDEKFSTGPPSSPHSRSAPLPEI